MAEALQLFNDHVRWAYRQARRRARKLVRRMPASELEGAALEGLWQACQRYRPGDGPLVNFAYRRVHGAMLDWVRQNDWMPRTARAAGHTTSRPSLEGLAAAFRLEGGTGDVQASLMVDRGPNHEDTLELQDWLRTVIRKSLPWRDRIIVRLYYDEGMRFAEIGRVLGMTEVNAAERHRKLLAHLRDAFEVRERIKDVRKGRE